jgi:hypothetical protein
MTRIYIVRTIFRRHTFKTVAYEYQPRHIYLPPPLSLAVQSFKAPASQNRHWQSGHGRCEDFGSPSSYQT